MRKSKSTHLKMDKRLHFIKEDILIANKHMKRCSTLVIREMKFKTTVRDHFTVISRANIKEKRRKAGSSVGEAVGGNN